MTQPRVKRGKRAATRTGGKRRAKFQPYRTSNGKGSAVTVRSLETGEVIRVEDPVAERKAAKLERKKAKQQREKARADARLRAHAHNELNRGWASAVERDAS